MALPGSYLITTKNLEEFLNALRSARAPERVTSTFLKNLEFQSSNDRLFIGMLKMLGLIDDSGVPTTRYYEFLDQSRSPVVIAQGLREAYADLFSVNVKANELTADELKNKFKTLSQGQYSDNVLSLMAKTFKALSDLAEWEIPTATASEVNLPVVEPAPVATKNLTEPEGPTRTSGGRMNLRELHYNIQIILPETRDTAVFDAIFESLRKHLLQ